ncbi:MAG: hypothetical protein NC120_07745 [Ruminococcus sp.]|nr:hypothetical protein [Ruminococcus sp.]
MIKTNIKRITAAAAALAVMSSLTGCGEKTTWGADIDQIRVPAGIFIYYLYNSYYTAQGRLSEETAELGSEAEETQPDLFSSQIEGKDSKQWIYDEATKSMQEYAAVEAKFDEYGLALTSEEREAALIYCDQLWDYAGEYYVGMGISQDSYNKIYLNSEKRSKLFEDIYSEGGEQAVSDEELKSYLDENYAMVNFIKMELKDGDGNLLKSDGKAERMAMAEDYIERYKNGEDLDALNAEYEEFYSRLQEEAAAAAEAEQEGNSAEVDESDAQAEESGTEDGVTPSDDAVYEEPAETDNEALPEETQTWSGEDSADFDMSGIDDDYTYDGGETLNSAFSSNKQAIERSGTAPDSAVVAAVFDEMSNGEIKVVESTDGEYYYVVVKLDILENDDYLNSARESLLYEMKSEDFDELIAGWTETQTVSKNEDAYKRYDPQKMFGDE